MTESTSDQTGGASQVIVKVNDRPYAMQCDPGEEEHLSELAQLIDTEVSKLKRNFGQVGDTRLLLMAGLVVADRLASALLRIEDLEQEAKDLAETSASGHARSKSLEGAVAERVEAAAARLEALAREFAPGS
ncbi:MAG: cell division protein ZapA [Hyphomicrobiales bacterium]